MCNPVVPPAQPAAPVVPQIISDGKKEACKTYIEQTKLLVTLSSAFLFAPIGLFTLLKDKTAIGITGCLLGWLIVMEIVFVLSVLFGYVVHGTIAGSQNDNSFNVFRTATMVFSLLQLGSYLSGMVIFVFLIVHFV
ncbi:MAG: hypothetical protein WCK92_07990 [Bacteroidota bacterium]